MEFTILKNIYGAYWVVSLRGTGARAVPKMMYNENNSRGRIRSSRHNDIILIDSNLYAILAVIIKNHCIQAD